MSTRPGSHNKKKPAQKHKNNTAYKFDKYRTDPQAKILKSLQVLNCCPKCTDTIEWKIKYGKYKLLTAPAKCVDCLERKVKHNYHVRCESCVERTGKCAKCGDTVHQFVNIAAPSQRDLDREEAEFQRDMKCLPERKRRVFLRYLETAIEDDPEEKKQMLKSMIEKFGKEDFGLGDLNIEDDFPSDEDEDEDDS